MILEKEDLCIALYMNLHLTDKALRKYAIKLYDRTVPHCRGYLKNAINAKSISRFVKDTIDLVVDKSALQHQLFLEAKKIMAGKGFDGMVVIDDDVYGVMIDYGQTPDPEDKVWAQENEFEVVTAICHQTMNNLQINKISCEIVLFKEAGFKNGVYEFHNLEIERELLEAATHKGEIPA